MQPKTAIELINSLQPTDPRFLTAALQSISKVLKCRWTGIGRLAPDRKTVDVTVMYDNEEDFQPFSYDISNSPCDRTYNTGTFDTFCCYPENVAELFPKFEFFRENAIQFYMCEAIADATGTAFAHTFALDTQPFQGGTEEEQFFRLVSQRIGAVLNQQRTEEALRRSELQYRTVVNHIADTILIRRLDGRIVDCNDHACRSLGYTREELLSLMVYDIEALLTEQQVTEGWKNTPKGEVLVFEGVHQRKDGSRFPVELRGRITEISGEDMVITSARDISNLKQAEHVLVEARREAESANRAKSAFVANISHELRTPLNAIIGFSDILKEQHFGPLGSTRYIQYAKDIHSSGKHLLEIVSDILDLSKIEAGESELREQETLFGSIIQDCLKFIAEEVHERHLIIENTLPRDDVWLLLDPLKLRQVMINLLTNAVKFTDPGGTITLDGHFHPQQTLVITVTDTGIGISPEQLEEVFEPFRQVEPTTRTSGVGTGLGLPIARRLCELHNGQLTLESEFNKGTRAVIRLPASRLILKPSAKATRPIRGIA